ncbi:hypothetical protein Ocin01_11658 [Orchesella cincta]|uniref:Uncharacterized protein n=1 Tax=Orchesella cincta TaxID=48709 RepID=A0A1D2MQ65_ORCCI|nr:hypothetical protein Ocin01_11658 [Orchesella cincta]
MKPIEFKWRKFAQIIGWIDFVLANFKAIICLLLALAVGADFLRKEELEQQLVESISNPIPVWTVQIPVLLLTVFCQIWAAHLLIRSTNLESSQFSKDFSSLPRFWLIVNILIVVVCTLLIVPKLEDWSAIVKFLIPFALRVVCIYGVWKYNQELKVGANNLNCSATKKKM